jgi:SAM-dependent methyltransferase
VRLRKQRVEVVFPMDSVTTDTELGVLLRSMDRRLALQTELLTRLVGRLEELVQDQAELRDLLRGAAAGPASAAQPPLPAAAVPPVEAPAPPASTEQPLPSPEALAERMRRDWDGRAREDAYWYIAGDSVAGPVKDETHFTDMGQRDVDRILRGLDKGWLATARTLEIGCGAGRMTEFLLPRVGTLTAIDVSEEMVELARRRLGERENLQLLLTSGVDLSPFGDGAFDLVLTYVVFHHVPKSIVREYFREIYRVLSPGGVLRAQLSEITDPSFVNPAEIDTFNMRSWTPEEIEAELTAWASVEIQRVTVTDNTDHLWVTARR